jgi:hypothetical protein
MCKSISPKKIFGLIVAFVMLCVMIAGCGPTKQELAAREADRKAEEQEISQIKAQLKKSAQLREASGERIPPKVEDPGYGVGDCVKPKLPDNIISIYAPGIGTFVCGNTKAGSKILAWRKWYCKGVELSRERYKKCVLSEWENGEPTFGPIIQYSYSSAIRFENDPAPRMAEIRPFKLE